MTAGKIPEVKIVAENIRKMEDLSIMPIEAWKCQMKHYTPVDPVIWSTHFPEGCQERSTIVYLTDIYSNNQWAEETGSKYREDHGGKNCPILNSMVDALANIDSMTRSRREVVIKFQVLLSICSWGEASTASQVTWRSQEWRQRNSC